MITSRSKLMWSMVATLIALPPFMGCEVEQSDVDAARQRAAEERRDVGEAVRDSVHDLGEAGRDARDHVAEEAREANQAEREADRLAAEMEQKKDRDSFLLTAKDRLAEVDAAITKRRAALKELEDPVEDREELALKTLDDNRDALDKAIDNAETASPAEWLQYKPAVEQALQRLKDVG